MDKIEVEPGSYPEGVAPQRFGFPDDGDVFVFKGRLCRCDGPWSPNLIGAHLIVTPLQTVEAVPWSQIRRGSE